VYPVFVGCNEIADVTEVGDELRERTTGARVGIETRIRAPAPMRLPSSAFSAVMAAKI
jgi:hypothetical protein